LLLWCSISSIGVVELLLLFLSHEGIVRTLSGQIHGLLQNDANTGIQHVFIATTRVPFFGGGIRRRRNVTFEDGLDQFFNVFG